MELRVLAAREVHIPPESLAIKRAERCLSGQHYLGHLPDVPVGILSLCRRFVHTQLLRLMDRPTNLFNYRQGQNGRPQPQRQGTNRGRVASTGQQDTTRTTTNAAQAHAANYTSSFRLANQGSAPSTSNAIQCPATSVRATAGTQTQLSTVQPTPTQAPIATAPAGMSMLPQVALNPEKWGHMTEVSQAFQEHVSHMLTELDKEDVNANEFGLGELRRRPLGALFD